MSDYKVTVDQDECNSGSNRIDVKLPDQEIMVVTEREPPEDYDESEVDTALYYAVERIAELETKLENSEQRNNELVEWIEARKESNQAKRSHNI